MKLKACSLLFVSRRMFLFSIVDTTASAAGVIFLFLQVTRHSAATSLSLSLSPPPPSTALCCLSNFEHFRRYHAYCIASPVNMIVCSFCLPLFSLQRWFSREGGGSVLIHSILCSVQNNSGIALFFPPKYTCCTMQPKQCMSCFLQCFHRAEKKVLFI